ncbi:MAG: hypothetical protein IPJ74_02685 [Saprospiraceae bacterium]|nr:hypothetical protein [Saprospiraceae bacterium]
MKKNILEFITVIKHKNGELKITHNLENEANIYLSIIQMRDAFWILENENSLIFLGNFQNDLIIGFLKKNLSEKIHYSQHYLQD